MYTNGNFGSIIAEACVLRPDATALIEGTRSVTYAELDARMSRVASALASRGVGPGDRVAILMDNQLEYPETLFGTMRAGAVAVPLNVRLADDKLGDVVRHSRAAAIIAGRGQTARALALAGALGDSGAGKLRALLVSDDVPADAAALGDAPAASGAEPLRATVADADPAFATVAVEPDAVCLQPYTSGSTGAPKGVLLTHGGSAWNTDVVRRILLLEPDERALVAVPVYHKNAMVGAIKPFLRAGGSIVILPELDAVEILRGIERHRVTYLTGVPAMYKRMLEVADDVGADTSSLRHTIVGSAEVPPELIRAFRARFGVPIVESYGSTEGGPEIALTPRWGVQKAGSTGLPVPGAEVRIVDPADTSVVLPPGEVGELLVRSPGVMKGYADAPELTAERLLPDGFLRTRDLATQDEDGYLSIVGRVDDMINAGGEHVFPADVEARLLEHPAVVDACVVPVPHALKGAVPVAFVVFKGGSGSGGAGATTMEEELRQWCLDRGPAFAHPRRVFFRDVLPLGGTGKVDRRALTDEARGLVGVSA